MVPAYCGLLIGAVHVAYKKLQCGYCGIRTVASSLPTHTSTSTSPPHMHNMHVPALLQITLAVYSNLPKQRQAHYFHTLRSPWPA
jgi:hypothetical protein